MNTKIPPGSESPYFWQLLQILFKPTDSLDRWSHEYGDTLILGGKRKPYTVSFSSPEAIRTVLNASPEIIGYVQKSELVKSLLGENALIFLPEQEHQRQRKFIVPSFHQTSLLKCGQEIIDVTINTISKLNVEKSFKVRSVMKEISLEVIVRSIFGKQDSSTSREFSSTIVEIFNLFDSPVFGVYLLTTRLIPVFSKWETNIWKKYRNLQLKLRKLVDNEITKHRNSDYNEENLFSLLTFARDENGQQMTNQEIYDALLTLVFAGFETAAAAMSWMLYWVHFIPEVKNKLTEEISVKDIELAKIIRLPYLNAVCNETLRITPPAISAFSRTVKQDIEIEGYNLEPGTNIDISIYLAHRRKSIYPEPEKFKPERFLQKQFSQYEYLPFGGGSCRCIGASLAQYEMRIVLATILNNFELEIVNPKLLKPKRHGIVMIPPKLMMKRLYKQ